MDSAEILTAVAQLQAALARFASEIKRQQALSASTTYTYPAQPEAWFTPRNESCIQYGPDDGADYEIDQ